MPYQLLDDRGQALDALFDVDQQALIFHSRGGTKGKDARNSDYTAALRLLVTRLQAAKRPMLGVWVDSSRVQALPLEERKILDRIEADLAPEAVVSLMSKRMMRVGAVGGNGGKTDLRRSTSPARTLPRFFRTPSASLRPASSSASSVSSLAAS